MLNLNNKYIVVAIGCLLIGFGLIKPNLSSIFNKPNASASSSLVVQKPTDENLLKEAEIIIGILKQGDSSRSYDGKRLASLYLDMANLISLDAEDQVIKNTEEIKQANSLSGVMLRLDIKGKYPNLAPASQNLIKTAIGDDAVLLDKNLRDRAVEAFTALAWAFNEGSK